MKKGLIFSILLFFLLPKLTLASPSVLFENFKEGVFVLRAEILETIKETPLSF
jgi:hypothetical protein